MRHYATVNNIVDSSLGLIEARVQPTDTFMRLFLLPGVAHCAGGEGPAQIDTLGPLMTWTELHQAPEMIVVGKPANQASGIPAEPGPGGPNAPGSAGRPNYPYSS